MQRDRLEGWMVQQIEQADLARETVIQLPTRASTAPAKASSVVRSPRSRAARGPSVVERPQSTVPDQPPLSPRDRICHRHPQANTRLESAAAAVGELDGKDSVAHQWQRYFQDPNRSFQEDGKVDRAQVLKSPRRREYEEEQEATSEEQTPATPWGMSREYILEYIRQSVMPSGWTTHARFTGEWEAMPPTDAKGRYAATDADDDTSTSFLTSLPPLTARSKAPSSPTRPAKHSSTTSPRGYRRPHPGATVNVSTSPTRKPPHSEERIQRVLAELRADPKAWEAFQKDVKRFLDDQRRKQHESNKIRENKQRAGISPRAPALLAERKRRRDERVERTQRQRQLLEAYEDARLEAMVLAYRQRTRSLNQSESESPRDVTTTVGYRRRQMWLMAVSFALAALSLQQRLVRAKQRQIIEKLQTRAARVIQRLWKKWKWRHASKQTIVIYTWLRKCLWKLLFKTRCRRKQRHATVLQRFVLDQFSGSRETRNFNRMMLKWRGKVIVSQRLGLAFVHCTRARLAALAVWWDILDHERQRIERQGHDRHLPLTDEKEAEWNALVNSPRGRLSMRRPSSRTLSIAPGSAGSSTTAPASSGTATTATPSPAASPSGDGPSSAMLSRRSVSTRQLLDQMDERLTSMQQVLTPIEIQRLQQHASHIVKIPKPIKLRLLQELLTAARRDYMTKLSAYQEQVACASYAREVKLDDARAIVQGGGAWGTLLIDTKTGRPKLRKPVFQLFSGEQRRRAIEELIRRGVQLTLESDPEQRALVERQRQQRLAFEVGGTPLGSGGVASALVSARKRESGTPPPMPLAPQPPTVAAPTITGDASDKGRRKSNRKLTFAVPPTIQEKGKR